MNETLLTRLNSLIEVSVGRAKREFPDEDWVVREAQLTIRIRTDGSDDEFLKELDQLLRKYGKLEEASFKCVPEFYNEDDEEWWTIGQLKDFLSDMEMEMWKAHEELGHC